MQGVRTLNWKNALDDETHNNKKHLNASFQHTER